RRPRLRVGRQAPRRRARERSSRMSTDRNWYLDAACREVGPSEFEPAPGTAQLNVTQIAEAKRVCDLCPVKAECLAEALAMGDTWTIRGGLTPNERKAGNRYRSSARRLAPCGTHAAYNRHL